LRSQIFSGPKKNFQNGDRGNLIQEYRKIRKSSHSVSKERVARSCIICGGDELSISPAVLMPFIAHRIFGWQPVEIDRSWGLFTIPNGHAFSICNSLFCRSCDFLFLDIRFTDAEMARLYKDYRGKDYVSLREQYEPGYKLRNSLLNNGVGYLLTVENFLKPHLSTPSPNILDWGGDTGRNTPFRACRSRLDILDLSAKETIDGARSVSLETAVEAHYDLIVCSQTLEHVPYPGDVLAQIATCMRFDTILYVELPFEALMKVPCTDDRNSTKRHWHEHINFFSIKSLEILLSSSGFKLVNLTTTDVEVAGCSVSIIQATARLSSSPSGRDESITF
jgi:hypothetical protein